MRSLQCLSLVAMLTVACNDQGVTAINAAPEATITSHEDGDVVLEGDLLAFRGLVSDSDHAADQLLATWYAGTRELCAASAPDADGVAECTAVLEADETEIALEVVDPQGKAAADLVTLLVQATEAPSATILAPEPGGVFYSDQLVSLEGQVSDAEDAPEDLAVWWESSLEGDLGVDAQPDSSGLTTSAAYLDEGEHQLTLTAEDLSGKTGIDSVVITVGPPNSSPGCAITSPEDGSAGEEGALVTLRGQVDDADVSPDWLTVSWSSDRDGALGDSTPDSGGEVAISTSDLSVATHTILLTVADEVGATCTDFILYTVGTPPSVTVSSPVAGDSYEEAETITFTGTVSDNEDSPTALDLSWDSDLDGVLSTAGADSTGLAQFTSAALVAGEHTLTVTVTDTAGLYARALLTFTVNGVPTAPVVALSPDPAVTGDDLSVSITTPSVDPEGDAVSYTYAWYRNGALSSASTGSTVSSANTARSDTWRVVVTPTDGSADGTPGEDSLTIGNTAPVLASVSLTPDPATAADTLLCSAGSTSDADGDSVSLGTSWQVSGATVSAAGPTLEAPAFTRGDTVTCTMTPDDGTDAGAAVVSNTVTIGNTAPSVSAVSISPDPLHAGDTASCAWSGFSDDDGDADASTAAWTINSAAAGSGTSLSASIVRADVVTCTVTPSDGTDTGTPVSASLTVENTAPSISSVTITPDPASASDTLSCAWSGYSDADGDTDASTVAWTIGGASAGTTSTLSSGFVQGDTVACTVTPHDGTDAGTALSASITVGNAAPVVTAVSLTPTAAYTDDTLSAGVSTSDADGDTVSLSYAWTVDGAAVSATGSTLSGISYFDKHQDVVVTVTPHDGTDSGAAVSSAAVTILNTPPEAPAITIDPSAPAEGIDDLLCTITTASTDADGDSIDYGFDWDVGGTLYTGTSTTTWLDDTIPGSATTAGEVWTCAVTPDDGDDFGDYAEATVTIESSVGDCGAGVLSGAYGSSWQHLATAPDYLMSLMDYHPSTEPYVWNSRGNSLNYYDPGTDTWGTVSSSTPYVSAWNSTALWDDDLWMIRNDNVYQYDIATDGWTTVGAYTGSDDMNLTVADCEGRIYGHSYAGEIIIYDTVTGTVTEVSTGLGTQCETRMAFDPDERAIFFGAFNYANLYRFDIDTYAVTTMASHPEAYLNDIFCGDHSGHLYAAGGSSGSSVWQYDIASNSWSSITSFPVDHGNNGSCTVSEDGWLYMADMSVSTFYRLPLY